MSGDFFVFMRSSSERRGAGDSLRSAPYRARSCCTCRSTSANVGRILGVRSQHMRRISESCWDHMRRSGSSGRMLSATGEAEVSAMLRTLATDSLTERKVANSLIVCHWPRQLALGQELDAGDRACVDVHLLREAAVSAHELWSLPSKRPICNRPGRPSERDNIEFPHQLIALLSIGRMKGIACDLDCISMPTGCTRFVSPFRKT